MMVVVMVMVTARGKETGKGKKGRRGKRVIWACLSLVMRERQARRVGSTRPGSGAYSATRERATQHVSRDERSTADSYRGVAGEPEE